MSHLQEIFSDLQLHSDKWEPYFDIYTRYLTEKLFDLREKQEKLVFVEVGVQKGGSLQMWSEYLAWNWSGLYGQQYDYQIYGIDINPECEKLEYADKNVHVVIGNQENPLFWDDFLKKVPKIDFFIDDGGHFMNQQILTFEKVFPHINEGGLYICEDCHTSYEFYNGGGLGYKGSFIEYAKSYIDVIHKNWWNELDTEMERRKLIGKDLTSVSFYDSIVVFEKDPKKEMKRVFPKKYSSSE